MNDTEPSDDWRDNLYSAMALSGNILAAQNGDDAAREQLAEPRTLPMKFPGNRQRAMGHALVIEEDLEELGIDCEREYREQLLPPKNGLGAIHRIDIHIEGGDPDSVEEGGA